jgi:Flp pilus assembly protein TadD
MCAAALLRWQRSMKSMGQAGRGWRLWAAGLAATVCFAYANHFENGFHFDDGNVVVDNPYVHDIRNIPRFFVDATTFSSYPDHQIYRPITSASLAIDYWLGGGLRPFWFHVSTFFWYLAQLFLMFLLFRRLLDASDPHPTNVYTALAATAIYGVHPAMAETVNYINQRADLFCTLGTAASLLWFAARPADRRRGWYLLPALAAFFAKPPVLIFPFVLFYVYLFEQGGSLTLRDLRVNWERAKASMRETWPALAVMAVSVVFAWWMTPAAFNPGGESPALYRLTQPRVALHYFKSFFLPTELSADTDWRYVSGAFSPEAVAGYLFVGALLGAAMWASRRPGTRPVAFGIVWFFLALLPTSLVPLAEVTNDHRMFFPFVGLALAVVWTARLAVFRRPAWRSAALAVLGVVLALFVLGTRERNRVWRTDETLWKDVLEKSPRNGRGWMAYGQVFMNRGEHSAALPYLEHALKLMPYNWAAEANLAITYGELGRNAEAEAHFRRSVELGPTLADSYFCHARWLHKVGRAGEAAAALKEALGRNPALPGARQLEPEVEARLNRMMAEANSLADPQQLVWYSDQFFRAGRYGESLRAASRAAELDPRSADAFNNMAACYNAMSRWEEGSRAAAEAVRLRPGFQLAINNLEWANRRGSAVR